MNSKNFPLVANGQRSKQPTADWLDPDFDESIMFLNSDIKNGEILVLSPDDYEMFIKAIDEDTPTEPSEGLIALMKHYNDMIEKGILISR